jgi:hypothetical protein
VISFHANVSNGVRRAKKFGPSWKAKVHERLRAQAKKIVVKARSIAPKRSMSTANAIYGRAYKEPLRVIIGISPSLVSKSGYRYPLFLTGKETITISKPNKFFLVGQTIQYGMPAVSPSGRPIEWSASPRWWDGVRSFTNRSVPQIVNSVSVEAANDWRNG